MVPFVWNGWFQYRVMQLYLQTMQKQCWFQKPGEWIAIRTLQFSSNIKTNRNKIKKGKGFALNRERRRRSRSSGEEMKEVTKWILESTQSTKKCGVTYKEVNTIRNEIVIIKLIKLINTKYQEVHKCTFYLFPPPLSGLGPAMPRSYLCIGGDKQFFFFQATLSKKLYKQ